MEVTTFAKIISEVGFPIGIAIIAIGCIWYLLKVNKENTDKQIARLDKNIGELKEENKEDKRIFQTAINSFNESVKEFKSVNSEISKVNYKMENMQKDIIEIKAKVN